MSHSTNYNSPAKTPMQYAQETFDLVKSHVQQLGGWRIQTTNMDTSFQ